jgi:hypothetical protein
VEEVFVVAFHAADGGVDDVDGCASLFDYAVADTLDGGLASFGVADDASLADVETAGFELRLDEDDGFALPGIFWCSEGEEECGEDERGGDEGDVHGDEDRGCGAGGEEFAGGEEAGVGALAESDVGIVAELLGDLTVAGVNSQDRVCAVLEHAIGEASGGGTDVDAGEAGERDGPVFEGSLELETAAADVLEIGAEEADDGFGGDWGAGLVDALLADEDATGEDEGLGSFARGGVALIDKELVEANLFSARVGGIGHQLDSGGGDKSRNLRLYFQVCLMMVQAARGLKGVEHVGLIWDKVG